MGTIGARSHVAELPIDICALSACELARRIASGAISARDAVEAYITRIEQVNGKINAVVVKRYDAARSEADAIDQRRARGETLPALAGVPITVKECLDVAGTPSTFGLPSRAGPNVKHDDPYVARMQEAGAIVLAKTNAAQLLIFVETDNPVYGPTKNPWNPERSGGGSSGGEGAILGAGGSPLGLGTDIGGSVRIPAHFCGATSIRPTAGRAPDCGRGSVPIGQRGVVSQVGPMARSVDDLALALGIINGGHGLDHEAVVPLGDFRAVDVSKLRVAVLEDDGVMPPSPAIARAVREAADILKAAGADIVTCELPSFAEALRIFFACVSGDRAAGLRRTARGGKVDPRAGRMIGIGGLPPGMRRVLAGVLALVGQRGLARSMRLFAGGSAAAYWDAIEQQMDYRTQFRAALDRHPAGAVDLILMPPFGVPAVRHGATANMPFAGTYSILSPLLGYPAGVVPLTRVRPDEQEGRTTSFDVVEKTAWDTDRGSAGLPVGVQILGRPWRDDVVLAAMKTIEMAARRRSDFPLTAPL